MIAKDCSLLDDRIYVIAEVAQAHDGSLGNALAYAKTAKECGCNAVKYQIHIPSEESSLKEKFRIKGFPQDKTRYEYWERTSFTKKEWEIIREYCSSIEIDFIVSTFSNKAVEWAQDLKIDALKVGSGDVSNSLMLQKLSNELDNNMPILISSGMSNYKELDDAISILKENNRSKIIPMQCTSSYPTEPEEWGLNNINLLKEKYKFKIGFSDHSGDIFSSLAAISLGAEVIESHIVFSKNAFGPDTSSSLTPSQFKNLIKGAKLIKKALKSPVNKDNKTDKLKDCIKIFQKRVVARKYIQKGEVFKLEHLKTIKGIEKGITDKNVLTIIGKKSIKDYQINEPILEGDY